MNDITYRFFITREFDRRCQKNPSYSLRAFARDLEISVSSLSEILRVQAGLSARAAVRLVAKLRLSEVEAEYFKALVEAEHSRSIIKKKQAKLRLQVLQEQQNFRGFDQEKAKFISDWYYSAILELTELDGFESNEKWIAKKLGMSLEQTQLALQRLFQFELLDTVNGRWVQTHKQLCFESDVVCNEFKKHHLQMLEKAKTAITDLDMDVREVSSVTLAISSHELPRLKKFLSATRKTLMMDAEKMKSKDRIYALTLHLFPVDQKISVINQASKGK